MTEQETITGFSIPKRELTQEESERKITWERIRDFHYAAGEDFLDTTSYGNPLIFAGWLLHKYPDLAEDIIKVMNDSLLRFEIMDFAREIDDEFGYDDETDIDKIYYEYCEFVNLSPYLKKKINQVLIQVKEYYT